MLENGGRLEGRATVVTGGGQGIGAEVARAFVGDGAVANDLGVSKQGALGGAEEADEASPTRAVAAQKMRRRAVSADQLRPRSSLYGSPTQPNYAAARPPDRGSIYDGPRPVNAPPSQVG